MPKSKTNPASQPDVQPLRSPLTVAEKVTLDSLYVTAGAWTPQEAYALLGERRTRELIAAQLLGIMETDMGPVLLLLAAGRVAVFGTAAKAQSLARQIDRAYLRLSIAQLGWRIVQPGQTEDNLAQYDTSNRMVEVINNGGRPAMVGGSLQNGGMTRQSIENIASRLRSMALFKGFDVILLTPNRRRGTKRALKEVAFMVLMVVLPVNPGFPEVKRVKVLPSRVARPDTPFLSGESWQSDPRILKLPALTREILQLKRSERIDFALRSLECDATLTDGQLLRWYGLRVDDLGELSYVRTIVRPHHADFRSEKPVTFVAATRRFARLEDSTLGHRAGTAEMRHLMGVASDERSWKAEHRETLRFEEPDAYHFDDDGAIHAVEFDTGAYTARVIDSKLSTFEDRGFSGINWGVTTPRRQVNLTSKIRHRLESDVLLCRWYEVELR